MHSIFRIKQAMSGLETAMTDCPDLLTSVSALSQISIRGVGFTELFAAFDDVDHFCGK